MLTAVDHLVVGVGDMERAVDTYRRLGFDLTYQPAVNRDSAFAVFGDFYLEFAEHDDTEGLSAMALRSDDLDADVGRLRVNGIPVGDPVDDPLDGPGGSLSRRTASVDGPIPLRLVDHRHDTAERVAFLGGDTAHPNTATDLERTYVAVESIAPELERFEQVLGVPAPQPEMGTVIMSLMSVFYLGGIGIAVAEPRGPGPTADALSANGQGMFQVLFRAEHLDRAAELMVDNGMPAPTRGTRLSGESALLVSPDHACNVFVALAGQP